MAKNTSKKAQAAQPIVSLDELQHTKQQFLNIYTLLHSSAFDGDRLLAAADAIKFAAFQHNALNEQIVNHPDYVPEGEGDDKSAE